MEESLQKPKLITDAIEEFLAADFEIQALNLAIETIKREKEKNQSYSFRMMNPGYLIWGDTSADEQAKKDQDQEKAKDFYAYGIT